MVVEGPVSGGGLGSPAGLCRFRRWRALEGGAEGSMYDSCNPTGHVTRKTLDNYMVLRKVQFALLSKIGKRKLVLISVVYWSACTCTCASYKNRELEHLGLNSAWAVRYA